MKTRQVKTNTKYQRDIDRSFAVIFHNLERIRESKPFKEKKNQIETFDADVLQPQRTNFLYFPEASTNIMSKRVSFSVDTKTI